MLSISDVYHILDAIPDTGDFVLIGGQALNFWAEQYADRDEALKEYLPFTSMDVDFLGGIDMSATLHDVWGGKLIRADMDTHTPMIAKLNFQTEDGRPVVVDFLDMILGPDKIHIRKEAGVIKLPNSGKTFRVMNPAHCLASRLINTYGMLNRRSLTGGREIRRTALAVRVLHHHIADMFHDSGPSRRAAYRMVEYTADLAADRDGLAAWHLDGTDILEAIPSDSGLGMSGDFLSERLPRIREYIAGKRQHYSRMTSSN